jgi:hypothetical protein
LAVAVCISGHATTELNISENGRIAIVSVEVEISLFYSGSFIVYLSESVTNRQPYGLQRGLLDKIRQKKYNKETKNKITKGKERRKDLKLSSW